MIPEQIPLLEMEAIPVPELVAPRQNLYLVAAYRKGFRDATGRWVSGYWKVHRETNDQEYVTVDPAREKALSLSAHWTNRVILHVVLGGE